MDFTLTLVRHGESAANASHMLSGWMDVDLTSNGRKELEYLKNTVDYPESEAYFSSSLKRCIDTFHILFPDATPIIRDDFKEINFCSLEGRILKSPEEMASYFSSWVCDKTCQDEETMSSVMNRSEKAVIETVENLEREGKNSALIVTHSGFIRSLIIKLFKLDRSCFLKMFVPNGLGYVITFKDTDPIYYRKLGAKSISFS